MSGTCAVHGHYNDPDIPVCPICGSRNTATSESYPKTDDLRQRRIEKAEHWSTCIHCGTDGAGGDIVKDEDSLLLSELDSAEMRQAVHEVILANVFKPPHFAAAISGVTDAALAVVKQRLFGSKLYARLRCAKTNP